MSAQKNLWPLERVMYSGGSTYGARRVVVMPAHAGIPAAPRIWIPVYAGMTFHLSLSMHLAECSTCITGARGWEKAPCAFRISSASEGGYLVLL
jgi:hypothetical protein